MNRPQETQPVLIDRTQIALALLAVIVAQVFRATFFGFPLLQVIEALMFLGVPVIAFSCSAKRLQRWKTQGNQGHLYFACIGTILFVLLCVATQIALRQFDYGDAYEIVVILGIVNFAWCSAVFAVIFRFDRERFLLCSFMVLFVCFTTQEPQVYVASSCYSIVALWWMIENYWKRFESRALDFESTSLPIRWTVTGASMIALVLIGSLAAFVGPVRQTIFLPGLMWSSGGTDG
ncbi:MAG: hypothetical protein VX438_08470, partial [Planctomycetota bacterium]|nr:hypothetical protein [Planctomycetota bacterium]